MKTAKLIVMYPTPADVDRFVQRYAQKHVPMAVEKLAGKTRFSVSLIKAGIGQAQVPFHRIAELHFPTMHDLEACLNSTEGLEHRQQGIDISMEGKPLILIAEVVDIDF